MYCKIMHLKLFTAKHAFDRNLCHSINAIYRQSLFLRFHFKKICFEFAYVLKIELDIS